MYMKCKQCKNEKDQIKGIAKIEASKTKVGIQRYKCKICGKYYISNHKERTQREEVKKQAIKLYLEGNSGRAVGRILGIGKNTCLNWIRKYAKGIKAKEAPNERVNVIEKEELYSFIERKKQSLCDNSNQQGYSPNRRI